MQSILGGQVDVQVPAVDVVDRVRSVNGASVSLLVNDGRSLVDFVASVGQGREVGEVDRAVVDEAGVGFCVSYGASDACFVGIVADVLREQASRGAVCGYST